MRKLLLYSPFLWLRQIVLWVLIFLLLVVLILYVIANSSLAVKKVVEAFAPDYNITYEHISGNAFSGFEIKNPRYNDKTIAQEIILKWNPNTLANKKVTVNKVHLKGVNIEVLKSLVSVFATENNNSIDIEKTVQSKPSTLIAKEVNIETLELSILPYTYDPVMFSSTRLVAKNLSYDVENKVVTKANLELNVTSNLSHLSYVGEIKKNVLLGQIILTPQEELYRKYKLPLRKDAIAKIVVDMNASDKMIIANMHTKAKQILKAKEGAFNVDVDSFDSYMKYDLNSSVFTAKTDAKLSTPYAKNIVLHNTLTLENELKHQGWVHIATIEGLEAKFVKPLKNIELRYSGDAKSIQSTFNSEGLKGYFNSVDFEKAKIHVETKEPLLLAGFLTLPSELKEAKASCVIDVPLYLKDFSNIDAKVKVESNVVHVDADVKYADTITVEGQIVIPKYSLLKAYSQDVVWDKLSPIDTTLRLKENQLTLGLDAQALKSHLKYNLDSGITQGKIDIAGLGIDIEGNVNKKLSLKTKIKSVKVLGKKLNKLYVVGDLPPLEGAIDASIDVDKLKNVALFITAPKLTYRPDKKTKHSIEDIQLKVRMKEDIVFVKSYNVVYNKQHYFSSKTAKVELGDTIHISNFWINDGLKIEGDYTPKTKQGDFTAKAKRFHFKDKMADIYTKIDITASLDGNDTRVAGKVVLLKGQIRPQIEGRSFATDSDIIILQNLKNNTKSPFMQNLSLMLKIETLNPLRVKQNAMNIKVNPDITINKEKNAELLYLGTIDLIKGSSYIFQEKKFVLAKSAVYFTGNINKPLLDMKAVYKSLNHLITISVTGTLNEPIINFSSNPSLTREQILSVILFDSEGSGDTHSGNEMMRMMGGAMAKAALSDVGVKVDHLAFGEGNSIEVGKKISSKTTVIYINGEIPQIKLKYQHGKRTESVIGVSEESQSYDIIYKRDF